MTGEEFRAAFTPGAASAGLARKGGRAAKWVYSMPDGRRFTFALQLNNRNMAAYPREFTPDITWPGPHASPRDTGTVSFYQYALPEEIDRITALHRRVIDTFVAQLPAGASLGHPASTIIRLYVERCDEPIRPNQGRWLPYWDAADATAWGELLGSAMPGWIARFTANPETLDAWCTRVLWSKK